MKIAMQDVAKKLALWHTTTFRPIITHDDLEPIMASVGFVSLSNEDPAAALQWKEYCFGPPPPTSISSAAFSGDLKPRPRLPFPRIDGLHLLVYKAFLCVLEQYISPAEVHNLFHVSRQTHQGCTIAVGLLSSCKGTKGHASHSSARSYFREGLPPNEGL
ncbi:hypothetical protein M5K25_011501 [Dendrobium thyrsiflorum]|uniref:Uncharacterized protein n=1 Tax=Dendrobium thyrsiflorum TaxID=117978 RepID=A0ABD0V2W6_DENTH